MNNDLNHMELDNMLVLGAGELGMAIVRHLVLRRTGTVTPLAVLVSPHSLAAPGPEQARNYHELRASNVRLLPFDLVACSDDELTALLGRFHTVINCTGFVAGPGTQLRLTSAVLRAGVSRYFPWQFGVNYDIVGKGSGQPVFDEQYEVRTLLRMQTRTEWVIVSTGMFTSFLFEPAFGLVDLTAEVVRGLGSWDTKVTVTTPDDIGRLTTDILLDRPRIANEIVYVASDTLSYRELADVVEEVTGQRYRRELLTTDMLIDETARRPDDAMARYRLGFARGDGMWWDKDTTYNAMRNIPTTDTRTWLQQSHLLEGPD
ncbi:aromatic alcohol reductase [Janthinobacterium sp. RB2R34]|uniref:aromatic alcohol reductase n=1 Tax=Janthinobacterium sp. RB2R34 TaxID=3424193 RepID=UPI003F23EF8D